MSEDDIYQQHWDGGPRYKLKVEEPLMTPGAEVNPVPEEDILEEAMRLTSGDRNNSYGPPTQDFQRTADMWTAMLGHHMQPGFRFKPKHVALMMIALKLSRAMWSRKRDNATDAAGYARCYWMCEKAEIAEAARNPGMQNDTHCTDSHGHNNS